MMTSAGLVVIEEAALAAQCVVEVELEVLFPHKIDLASPACVTSHRKFYQVFVQVAEQVTLAVLESSSAMTAS